MCIRDSPLDAWDHELVVEAAAVVEDPEQELLESLGDEEAQEMEEGLEDEAAIDLGDDPAAHPPDDSGDEEGQLPVLDDKGQAHNPKKYPEIWGRISIVKEGMPGEAMSVYCRRHGCTIVTRARGAIPAPITLRWFLAGQELPAGRAAALQNRHKVLLQ